MTKLNQTVVVVASLLLFGCSSNGTSSPPVGTGGITGANGESVRGQTGAGGGPGGGGEIVASTSPVGGSTSTSGPGTTVPASTATGGTTSTGGSLGAGGKTAPASTATGGSSGGGNDTGAGQVTCTASDTGCTCSTGKTGATDLAACSKTSVVKGEYDKGICCKASDRCTCTSYSCGMNTSYSFCTCGATYTLAATLAPGDRRSMCRFKDVAYKCCHDSTLNRCTCAFGGCDATATEVTECNLALFTTCPSGQVAVDSCK